MKIANRFIKTTLVGALCMGQVAWANDCVRPPNLGGYNYVGYLEEGLAPVEKNGKYGFIDKTGKLMIALRYDGARGFEEGLAAVQQNDKWGFIDRTGKIVIAPQYDDAFGFSEGLANVQQNGEFFSINKQGERMD